MYPYRSLPENLTAFCAVLRDEHGFGIGPRELQDAARALGVTQLGDEGAVRNVLRPVLCGSLEHIAAFDAAFDAFFYPAFDPPHPGPEAPRPAPLDDHPTQGDISVRTTSRGPRCDGEHDSGVSAVREEGDAEASSLDIHEEHVESVEGFVRCSYSPLHGEGAAPDLFPVDAGWRAAASAFVSVITAGLSRRWRPARRGERFDLRRTLRYSLHTGGEAVVPCWQNRPFRRPRFVLLIDGSRSMSTHAQAALNMAVAIASVTSAVEAFTFSTALHCMTRDVRRAASGERRTLDYLQRAWGGGTNIGACLQGFLQRFGERLLARDSVIVIASDGLDVGAPDVLRQAMARLHRESAGVIWLNPLLDTPGYEPAAIGMTTARPFVATFACVSDPAGLQRLARTVRVRR